MVRVINSKNLNSALPEVLQNYQQICDKQAQRIQKIQAKKATFSR
jgi:DNA uptake protein ComE-like DNA-binding protein